MADIYKGRIAFFYPWGNLGAFSSLRDALTLFIEHGYWVDFFTQFDEYFPSSEMRIQGLSIITRPEAFLFIDTSLPPLIHRFRKGNRKYRWLMMNLLFPLLREFTCKKFLHKRHNALPYNCMVGMDPEGLASASLYANMLNVPFVYWSLELLLSGEISTQEKERVKKLEITDSRRALLTIVQDRWRGQVLIEENGIDRSRLCFVPNAPRGKARRKKGDYLHKRFNIPPDRKVILCAGTISHWSMSAEIVSAAADWPEEFVLVMQSRRRQDIWKDKYIEKVIDIVDPKKVIISFEPVPPSEYHSFVDSADVGLAFYEVNNSQQSTIDRENIRVLGLSSGKIAGYLYSGLPVIVNDAVIGPKELVESSGSGICVRQPLDIKEALALIFYRYDWYVDNACRCFNQYLELEKHFTPVIDKLEVLTKREYNAFDHFIGGCD
jgi:hypothetical protein